MRTGKQARGAAEGKKGSDNQVLNVRVPDELILELDFLVEKKVFNSRSEAIREFAREYLQEQLANKSGLQNANAGRFARESERGGGRW